MLNIKNPEAYELAHMIAEARHQTLTQVVIDALREQAKHIEAHKKESAEEKERRMKRIDALLAKIHALPVYDKRTADEIIGYDEYGLPT